MKNLFVTFGIILLLISTSGAAQAGTGTEAAAIQCAKSAAFLAPADAGEPRQYAPDRATQMVHLALDVTPDFKERTIAATAVLRFKPVAKPAQEAKFDAVGLHIASVESAAKILAWQTTDKQVVVTFAEPLSPGKEVEVTIKYSAEPTQGLYFRTPEMGYKNGDTHLFSQGEEIEARHWYPCMDSPNQRLTSEITCRVPEGMTVISNGRLLSQAKDGASGLVAFHWSQEQPHANYLVSLVAGYFKKIEDSSHRVPLAFFTPPSEINEATNSFRHTQDMMAFFEQEIGVSYPWAKYYQVCVNDFVAGGMENTSATTLTDETLFSPATENLRTSVGLIAHELAHQWFGDYVTCKDWSHVWLNEGFATYYESLYQEHLNGHEDMLYELYDRARGITALTNDFTPIVRRNYSQPGEMFGYLVYPKASWVLHMLRSQLGPELYRQCVKAYLQRHALGNVVTDDLRAVVEELSGRSYDRFFDQWLYHGHFPELTISYSWDQKSKLAKVSVQQTQDVNANVLVFQFPLMVRFKSEGTNVDRHIDITRGQEDFYFPLPMAPELVRVDPEYTLLARLKFTVPRPMLLVQVADPQDVVGRLLAVEQLAAAHDREAVSSLQKVLNEDPFYGLRIEAAKGLRSIHTDESLDALLASAKQPDARVRRAVTDSIGGFYSDKGCDFALEAWAHEKNPDIRSTALRDLGGYNRAQIHQTLLEALHAPSFRNQLAVAAIGGLRLQDDPAAVPGLLSTLEADEGKFTSRGFAEGLEAVAYLDRNEQDKHNVCDFLLARVNHKKRRVRVAVFRALGILGDPHAIAVLDKFATGSKEEPETRTAERVVADLRAGRKPVDDFKNLRQEVLDLEKANRELRQSVEELKKKVEAAPAETSTPARRPRKAPGRQTGINAPKGSGT